MEMEERPASECMNQFDKGHVLLAALMLIVLLGIASMTALFLASQDGPGVSAMREDSVAQQLADGAVDMVMSWFHDPSSTPIAIAELLAKRQGDLAGGPSFFDETGRSQFIGTIDRPGGFRTRRGPAASRLPTPGWVRRSVAHPNRRLPSRLHDQGLRVDRARIADRPSQRGLPQNLTPANHPVRRIPEWVVGDGPRRPSGTKRSSDVIADPGNPGAAHLTTVGPRSVDTWRAEDDDDVRRTTYSSSVPGLDARRRTRRRSGSCARMRSIRSSTPPASARACGCSTSAPEPERSRQQPWLAVPG